MWVTLADDGWLLDVHSLQWQQLPLPDITAHLWHTACLTQFGDVLVFGGCTNNILSNEEDSVSILYYVGVEFFSNYP